MLECQQIPQVKILDVTSQGFAHHSGTIPLPTWSGESYNNINNNKNTTGEKEGKKHFSQFVEMFQSRNSCSQGQCSVGLGDALQWLHRLWAGQEAAMAWLGWIGH